MPLPFLALIGVAFGIAGATSIFGSEENENENAEECTVSEAADILGLSEYTVKKKVREGALEARLAGKRYMISTASVNAYAKKFGRIGQKPPSQKNTSVVTVPAEIREALKEVSEEIWNNATLLQDTIDSLTLQQKIIDLEIQKTELTKDMATKANAEDKEEKIDKASQDILNLKIKKLQLSQAVKLCEAQIHYLEEYALIPVDDSNTESTELANTKESKK